VRWILVASLGAALLACGPSESLLSDAAGETPAGISLEEPTYRFGGLEVERSGNLYLAGQPDRAALEAARDAGVVGVVNLRRPVEMTWDEAGAVEALGLAYYHVPVGGSGDRSDAFAEVDRIVAGLDGPVLVHCASGGRVQHWLAQSSLEGRKSPDCKDC
jgi:uncharacterized protein (TIGR01244 family)